MPHPQGWWAHHMVGWWIWIPATLLLAWYLAFSEARNEKRVYVPWVTLGLVLASVVAHYLRSGWGQYFYHRQIWWSGLGSILAASLVPIVVCLLAYFGLRRFLPRAVPRAALAAAGGIVVQFSSLSWVTLHVGSAIMRL